MVGEIHDNEILDRIKSECRGYFYYNADVKKLYEFGPEQLRAVFPASYLLSIKPLSLILGLLYHIRPSEEKLTPMSPLEKWVRKSAWKKDDETTLVVYHSKLSLAQLEHKFKRDQKLEDALSTQEDNFQLHEKPDFHSWGEYEAALKAAIPHPFMFICYSTPGSEFLLIGDKDTTVKISELMAENPPQIPEIIANISGSPFETVWDAVKGKRILVHFDATKIARRTTKTIEWPKENA